MNRILRSLVIYVLIAVLMIFAVASVATRTEQPQELAYSDLIDRIENGSIQKVTFIGQSYATGTYLEQNREVRFETTLLPGASANLLDRLTERGIDVKVEPEQTIPWWVSFLPNIFLILLMVVLWVVFFNQMQGGGNRTLSFGKSRAKMHTESSVKVTFEDVAGVDEAKQELSEVVDFLKNPKRYSSMGAKIPKGVLLVGPPGTGKTLLGRAVAGEAGVPFFNISGSDFVEMFVGVGASRVRDMFETAKRHSPCIVFIDEIDAVGRQRGAGLGGGHDEREQTLNQLLVEMDGFETNAGIIVLAATNRPDVLDPALLRPGRFDRQVVVDRPDVKGREEILNIYMRNKPIAEDVNAETLAKMTPGFTGADLENLMNEAAILATRKNLREITRDEVEEAVDRVTMGPPKARKIMSEKDRKTFAYHEAGHALVGKLIPGGDPVHKVTIVGRGLAGGYTLTLPEEDRQTMTRTDLTNFIMYGLGGRVAEEVVFGDISTGAQSDLERTSKIARRMVTEWGMSEKLGPVVFGKNEEQVFLGRDFSHSRNYSEEVAGLIDSEIRGIIEDCYTKATELLKENRDILDRMVEALLEKETLNREEIDLIFEGKSLEDLENRDKELKNKTNSEKTKVDNKKEPQNVEEVLDKVIEISEQETEEEAKEENQKE
ncbi:MAG: ATP-dependent zinc metalloprotease FtsH [Bacillota bacterium]|nr:ATP-dependent zinc metalloprotease FtsH [Bacillota bacterium]